MYDIIQNVMQQSPRTIAIDGMCASGKTTLAELLHLQFPNSTVIHMDDFFLQPHQRTESRLQEVGGNIDYERFYEEIICNLNQSEGFTFRKYNCQNQTLGEPVHVVPRELIIIEGSYSHHPYFGDPYDLRIFCETSAEVQKERILKRNGPNMWLRFQAEWIPMEHAYFDTFHIKHKSGLLQ
jgi:uridine kinase